MIDFVWPWLFLLLPVPWFILRVVSPAESAAHASLKVPFLDELDGIQSSNYRPATNRWRVAIAMVAWLLLVTAATRPQWLGDPIQQATAGRDLMLAVDLSGSMQEQDFVIQGKTVDRLTATKWVASDFIKRREGDRLGLILFGERAYLQTPLTFDRKTVQTFLNEAAIGLAGKYTAIGDAIGLAVKRFKNHPENDRVLLLLTDGANTAGSVSPLQAADLAKKTGLTIYTIGIGADEMIVRDFFGSRKVNPSSDLDEDTLASIAEKTGGQYFRARDTQEFETIYALIDALEPIEKEERFFRPKVPLYPWPMAFALLLAAVLVLLRLSNKFS